MRLHCTAKAIAEGVLLLFFLTVPAQSLIASQEISSYGVIDDSMLKPRVEGAAIKDSSGKGIRLSGVACHPAHGLAGLWKGLQEDDVSWMKETGFTACRLSLTWNEIETSPGIYDTGYLETFVDHAVYLFQKFRIYVILDNHIWNGGPHFFEQGEGVPIFYCDTYSADSVGFTQFMLDFWANTGQAGRARQALVNFWKMLANRYKGMNVVAGYELFNEPNVFPNSIDYINTFGPQIMDFYNDELGPAIRSIDPDTILFYDAIFYEQQLQPTTIAYNTKQELGNVAWARSQYDKSWDYSYDTERSLDEHKAELQSSILQIYQHFVVTLGSPYFASEIGKGSTDPNSLEWVNDTLLFLDMYARDSFNFVWWKYAGVDSVWMPRDPTTGQDSVVVPILQLYAVI